MAIEPSQYESLRVFVNECRLERRNGTDDITKAMRGTAAYRSSCESFIASRSI
jgi:hypothetical protein